MTDQVWKTEIDIHARQTVKLPRGAVALHVAVQHGAICAWWRVTPKNPKVETPVYMHGTGHFIDPFATRYVGSVMLNGEALVFHVFTEEPSR